MYKKLFSVFASILFVLASCSNMIEDFKKEAVVLSTEFTVMEYYEAIENDNYDNSLTVKKTLRGLPERYNDLAREGFNLEEKKLEDGVLSLFYTRKRVEITFHPNGGEWDLTTDAHVVSGKYGERLPLIDVSTLLKMGYKFTGWSLTPDGRREHTPLTFGAKNQTFYALWDNTTSNYIVKIYEQNIYDDPAHSIAAGTVVENSADDFKYNYTLVAMDAHEGVPGTKSNYIPTERNGFYALPFAQVDINGIDEPSAVLEIYEKRYTYRYVFKLNDEGIEGPDDTRLHYAKWPDDTQADIEIHGRYEEIFVDSDKVECVREEPNGVVWNFEGWNKVGGRIDYKFTSNKEYKAIWDRGDPIYTVKHLFEQTDGNYIEDTRYPRETITSRQRMTEASPYNAYGFYALPFSQKEVKGDSSTVIEIKYDLVEVELILNANGGKFADGSVTKIVKGKYKKPVSGTEQPGKALNIFDGWNSSGGTLPATFPIETTEYEAHWKRNGAAYAVEYYFENPDDNGFTFDRNHTETLTGEWNAVTPVKVYFTPKTFEGFVLNKVEGTRCSINGTQVEINGLEGDDSTVAKLYYKRKLVNITVDPNHSAQWSATTWFGNTGYNGTPYTTNDITRTVALKYGQRLTNPMDTFHCKEAEHEFLKWEPAFPATVPLEDTTYTAYWFDAGAEYKIVYLFETLNCPDDAKVYEKNPAYPDVTKHLKPGRTTEVKAERVEGFTHLDIEQKVVAENGSTVVEVKYDRNRITLTFEANEGSTGDAFWTDVPAGHDKFMKEFKGKYGAPFTAPDSSKLSKPFGTFKRWILMDKNPAVIPATFPAINMVYYAEYDMQETTDEQGNLTDTSKKDIKLTSAKTGTNTYDITVELPFDENSSNWSIEWKVGRGNYTTGSKVQSVTAAAGSNTVWVIARYRGLDVPYSKFITLDVE